MIPLHPFKWPFFSLWRKSYMDLIRQEPIPQWGFFLLLFGRVFFVLFCKKFITNSLQGFPGFSGLSETFLQQSHQMTLHGVPQSLPPDWEHCYGLCWFVCPAMGQVMAWHAVSGCSKWFVIPRWWIAATLSWACGSAALSLRTGLVGKGGHSLYLQTCHWQSSGITAPHLSNDTALGL